MRGVHRHMQRDLCRSLDRGPWLANPSPRFAPGNATYRSIEIPQTVLLNCGYQALSAPDKDFRRLVDLVVDAPTLMSELQLKELG